jgi:poly-gamma-glutamate capsule biosynthesis protein CapA/YwtB (metallophosphatase superfamily)
VILLVRLLIFTVLFSALVGNSRSWAGNEVANEARNETKNEVTISFVGDVYPQVLFGEPQRTITRIKDYFTGSQIIFCNLESPLTEHASITPGKKAKDLKAGKDFILRSHPETIDFMKKIGFDVVSLANNHCMDYNREGLSDTIKLLDSNNILYCGAGENQKRAEEPVIIKSGRVKVAFIAFSEYAPKCSAATENSPGIAYYDYPPGENEIEKIRSSIKDAKKQGADLVIVSLHWGKEGSNKIEKYQRVMSRLLLDYGADCIIGHHPHVLRDIESHNGKTIAYSLGNFIFESSSDRDTVILKVHFTKDKSGVWKQEAKQNFYFIRDGIPEPCKKKPKTK